MKRCTAPSKRVKEARRPDTLTPDQLRERVRGGQIRYTDQVESTEFEDRWDQAV